MDKDTNAAMFGCSLEELKMGFENPVFNTHPSMMVMSILSDMQEKMTQAIADIDSGNSDRAKMRMEQARQLGNRAKFGVDAYLSPSIECEEAPCVETLNGRMYFIQEPIEVSDSKNRKWTVSEVSVAIEGYIPDVKVVAKNEFGLSAGEAWICDDDVFISGIMDVLEKHGYDGASFGRAESGMQGDDFIMLEPGKDFKLWISGKGWIDLDNPNRRRSPRP